MKKIIIIFSLASALAGCTTSQKGAAVGGLGGATLGGIIGHQSGDGVKGAAIGGAVGTIGGMIVGDKMEKKFCPVGGEVYASDVTYCPKHGVELKLRER
jgi:outer membrane lipoprotein SlyB